MAAHRVRQLAVSPAAHGILDLLSPLTRTRTATTLHATLCTALCALLVLSCQRARPVTVLRLAHGLAPTHPVHRAMEHLARDLEARSHGSLRVVVYPSEQLGRERECLELLQLGSLDMTKVSASVLESFAPAFRLLGQPYLWHSEEHAQRVLDSSFGDDLLETAAGARLHGLCFYDAGSRSFYTRDRPVRTPDDLRGLKIRTQESQSAMRMVEALGGAPTPIAWGELYSALQQGVVDGAENNPPSFFLSRHYEVCRYYTLDEHTAVPDVLLVSQRTWRRLSAPQQRWLTEAARSSAQVERQLWRAATAEALAALAAAGVEIISPDPAAFRARAAPLLEQLERDPTIAPWYARLRAQDHGVAPAEVAR